MYLNIKTWWPKVSAVFISILLCLMWAVPVFAQGQSSIIIQLEEFSGVTDHRQDVGFAIYKVGTVDSEGTPTFDAVYNVSEYPSTSAQLDAQANIIAASLQGATPYMTAVADAQGQASFTGLDNGIYLCVQTSSQTTYGEMTPALVSLPYVAQKEDGMYTLKYDMEIDPKVTPAPETPETPEETQPETTKPPKTGDETPIGLYVSVSAVALLCIGLILVAKIKREHNEE